MNQIKRLLLFGCLFFSGILLVSAKSISLDSSWKYADFSVINTGSATLYESTASSKKDLVIAVNAGHGTSGVGSKKTYCHPDKTPKVTGGSTAAGETMAIAVSSGMQFSNGTAEAVVTLSVAQKLKDKLLSEGYDVLMIRDGSDVQLDNIARTVIANNAADVHIAIHFDSSTSDKGAFYMSVPNNSTYRAMEPVRSTWKKHHELGDALISGLRKKNVKIYSSGSMEMDLTQTSFSTIPSIDIELGDKGSKIDDGNLEILAEGLLEGILTYDNEDRTTQTTNPSDPDDGEDPDDGSQGPGGSTGGESENPGQAPDFDDTWGDQTPIQAGKDGCETIFKKSDGSFNELGQFVQDLFTLIKFAAPVLVIAFSTVDYAKALSAQNADDMKKAHIKFTKRLACGVAVFLLPFILDLLFEIFGLYGLGTCGVR